jgi:hypothetical protein
MFSALPPITDILGGGGRVALWRTSVIDSRNFTRQATTLLKFAKSATNPQLAAVLVEKAADLKSQVDESNVPDAAPFAPDIEPPAR